LHTLNSNLKIRKTKWEQSSVAKLENNKTKRRLNPPASKGMQT